MEGVLSEVGKLEGGGTDVDVVHSTTPIAEPPSEGPLLTQAISDLVGEAARASVVSTPQSSGLTLSQIDGGVVTLGLTEESNDSAASAAIRLQSLQELGLGSSAAVTDRSMSPERSIEEEGEISESYKHGMTDEPIHPVRRNLMVSGTLLGITNNFSQSVSPRLSDAMTGTCNVVRGEAYGISKEETLNTAGQAFGPQYRPRDIDLQKQPWKIQPDRTQSNIILPPFTNTSTVTEAVFLLASRNGWAKPVFRDQHTGQAWHCTLTLNGQVFSGLQDHKKLKHAKKDAAQQAFVHFYGRAFSKQPAINKWQEVATGRVRGPCADNVITELNNYVQSMHKPVPRYQVVQRNGQLSGTMAVAGYRFTTRAGHSTTAEAKTDLASQAYKLFTGVGFQQQKDPTTPEVILADPGPRAQPPCLSHLRGQQAETSYETKLTDLAREFGFVATVQYAVRRNGADASYNCDLSIGGYAFKTAISTITQARCRELVMEKAFNFFSKALRPARMGPVPNFQALQTQLPALSRYMPRDGVVGASHFTVDDLYTGKYTDLEYDVSALTTLNKVLMSCYRQTPQWYERISPMKTGQCMYSCLLRWPSAVQTFGDLSQGYPDLILAEVASAEAALEWLAENEPLAKALSKTTSACNLTHSSGSMFAHAHEDFTEAGVGEEPSPFHASTFWDPIQNEKTGTFTEQGQSGNDQGVDNSLGYGFRDVSNGFEYTTIQDRSPQLLSGLQSQGLHTSDVHDIHNGRIVWPELQYPQPAAERSFRSTALRTTTNISKRAGPDLFGENESAKKAKMTYGDSVFASGTVDDGSFGRVEHVDGRYGF